MSNIVLKGMTWGHSRGITPLLAFSQRFSELYPNVQIVWEKRSLQQFADFPIEKLAEQYDLLIVDHPWVGCAAATGCVIPLNEYISADYLHEQAVNSVGGSHESYNFNGSQWALAIDAATPVASYRADLLKENNAAVPQSWDELLVLASKGKVAVPAIPIDLLMNFYMFCIANGQKPFTNQQEVIDSSTGIKALKTMQSFYSLVDKKMFDCNPIAIAELMSSSDDHWYCPFAYGYSNYSRNGYAKHLLTYTDLVSVNGSKLSSTLGGTGLSVSSFSNNKKVAVHFAEMIVSPECQSTFYTEHGGQPGHKKAWTNDRTNFLTNNYFVNTLPALERAYIRPRYNGYLHFQDKAGDPLHHYLQYGGSEEKVLHEMNLIYKDSLLIKHNQQL
jgi:multiple sugar transport system substrate-binding protein